MSLAKFESIKQKLDLCDVWHIRNPTVDDLLTAQNPHFFNAGSTMFFISYSIQEDVKQIDILPSINSDHSPVYLKLSNGNETSRGPSHWKFNNYD